jgi:hypothetical protein
MMSPDPAVQVFYWRPSGLRLTSEVRFGVVLLLLGFALGVIAAGLWEVSTWARVPAVVLFIFCGLLIFAGGGLLLVGLFNLLCHLSKLHTRFSVHADSVWIDELIWGDVFPKTKVVLYATIVWVKRERTACGDRVLIVHGAELGTSIVDEIEQADVEVIIQLLADRCPTTFTPEPPAGWQRPS